MYLIQTTKIHKPVQTKGRQLLTGLSSDTSQPRYSATVIMWFTMQSISCRNTQL